MSDLQRLKEMHLTMQGKHSVARNGTQDLLVKVVRREPPVPAMEWSAMQLPAGRSLQAPRPIDGSNAFRKTPPLASVLAVECR